MIVKSFKVARDLFKRRTDSFSTKNLRVMAYLYDFQYRYPSQYLTTNRTGYDRGLAFMPYGEAWKMSRKPIEESLNIHALQSLRPMHERHALQLVGRLVEKPESLHRNIRR